MRIPGADKAIANLMKWSAKEEWAPFIEHVIGDHLDIVCDRFAITDKEIADLLGDAYAMIYVCILEDFFTARFGDEGEKNVIDDYLKRRGWREKVPAKRYLEALRDSVLSLYEVVDLEPGHSLTVKDMILGGDPVTLEEKLGSETAARWDRIAGRIVTVNKRVYFTGAMLLFPHEAADEVLASFEEMTKRLKKELKREAKKQGEPADFKDSDLRKMILPTCDTLFTRIWLIDALERATEPLPEIRNSEGDEIVFSDARFPITGDVAKVISGLDEIDDFEKDDPNELQWTWHGHGSPSQRVSRGKDLTFKSSDDAGRTSLGNIEIAGDALVLSTNSKERADKGGKLLLSRLDGLVGRPLVSHQTLEKMLDEPSGPAPVQSKLPPEVEKQAIQSFFDSHYRQSLDDPLPILGGKTPRQAAKTRKGRAQVIDWLKLAENSDARRAARQGQEPYDFEWMWRALEIDDLGAGE